LIPFGKIYFISNDKKMIQKRIFLKDNLCFPFYIVKEIYKSFILEEDLGRIISNLLKNVTCGTGGNMLADRDTDLTIENILLHKMMLKIEIRKQFKIFYMEKKIQKHFRGLINLIIIKKEKKIEGGFKITFSVLKYSNLFFSVWDYKEDKKKIWKSFLLIPHASHFFKVWKNVKNSLLISPGFFYKSNLDKCICKFSTINVDLNMNFVGLFSEGRQCKNLIEANDILVWTINRLLFKKKIKKIAIRELNEFLSK